MKFYVLRLVDWLPNAVRLKTGMGSDFQFWLLFSFYLFSVLSVFHCVFL
jgi:hypothetical protein